MTQTPSFHNLSTNRPWTVIEGPPGPQGDPGPTGPQGAQGVQGPQGAPATVTLVSGGAVSSLVALAGIVGPTNLQAAQLTASGRSGHFVFNSSNLSSYVTADPAQGVFVAPTAAPSGASGAWVRQTDHLTPDMFGGTGLSDDTDALRRCFALACLLKLPVYGRGTTMVLNGLVFVGSTAAAPAAANAADGFTLRNLTIKVKAGLTSSNAIIYVRDCTDVTIEGVKWDTSEATEGGGQFQLQNVDRYAVRNINKVFTVAPGVTGGSAVSLRQDCANGSVENIVVKNAGTGSSGVFCLGATKTMIRNVQCEAGEECVDLSGCSDMNVEQLRALNCNEILDVGNSVRCNFKDLYGLNVSRGVSIKTEVSGTQDLGCNDNSYEDILVDGFTTYGILMSGGATTTQTLHNQKFRNVRLVATAATGSTVGFQVASGDVTSDYTKGLDVDGLQIEMNTGSGIGLSPIVSYRFNNVKCAAGATKFVSDGTPSSYTTNTKGLWTDIEINSDFGDIVHRGITVRGLTINGGKFSPVDSIGSRFTNITINNAPLDAFDLNFTNNTTGTSNKDVIIDGYTNINNGVSGGTRYALRIRHVATSGPIENVHIRDVVIVDNQGVATSGGFSFANATFDYCTMFDVFGRGIVNQSSYFMHGLNSAYDNINIRNPFQSRSGSSFTLNASVFWDSFIDWTGGGTLTLVADSVGVNDWPRATSTSGVNRSGGNVTIAVSGATVYGPTTIPNNAVFRIRKGSAASTYIIELAA